MMILHGIFCFGLFMIYESEVKAHLWDASNVQGIPFPGIERFYVKKDKFQSKREKTFLYSIAIVF